MSFNVTYTDETEYYVAFSHVPGIGPHTVSKMIARFGSIKAAYESPAEHFVGILQPKILKEFIEFRIKQSPYSILKSLLKKDIQVLTPNLSQYPNKLRNISDIPLCLYIKGDLSIVSEMQQISTSSKHLSIAVVGSRKCTNYGTYLTNLFTSRLASAGITIISGMAAGIDTIAHEVALKFKTKTLAILGSGVDIIYPASNNKLYARIISEGGAILSEFPPGFTTLPGLFVSRNRLISGLSDGVLIIEGTETSGTLKTARHAAEQDRPVFLPPYNLTSPYGYTFAHLMEEGGTFVFSPDDIFAHFELKPPALPAQETLNLTKDEAEIIALIRQEVVVPDKLTEALQIPLHSLLNKLTELEVEGYIAKNSLGEYYVC